MGRQDARQKKWGDEAGDKKNGEMRRETNNNGEMRHKTKKIGRQDTRQKKWGEETQDKKMGG